MSSLRLPLECMREIFVYQDTISLYRQLQVDKYWCSNAIQVLWQQPFNQIESEELDYAYEGSSYPKPSPEMERLIVRTLIACMSDESKQTLREAGVSLSNDPVTNIKPLFNYPSFIQNFDYYGVFRKVYVCTEENNPQRFLLYREICRLVFTHGLSVKYSLRVILHFSIHKDNFAQPFFPEQLQLSNIDGSYSKFDVLQIASCLSSDHLHQIARNCREIKKLELLFCSCEDNRGIIALINNTNYIYSLKLNSHLAFTLTTIPTNIFNALKSKLHLIREIEIELFKNFPIEILSECKKLRKLKMSYHGNFASRNNLELNEQLKSLKFFVNFDIFEYLEVFHASMVIVDISDIIKVIRKSNGNLKNINLYMKRFQDPENYAELFKMIAVNCGNLQILNIIITEDTVELISLLFSTCNNLIQVIFSNRRGIRIDISDHMLEIGNSIVHQSYLQVIKFHNELFISREVIIKFLNTINENARNNQRIFRHNDFKLYNVFFRSLSYKYLSNDQF